MSIHPPPHAPARADVIDGLVRGMALLEAFGTERQRLNTTQAAARAGITRTAARRYLLTLAALGYLESDGRDYWLSAKVLRLAGNYLASARLPRIVQPTLDALVARTGLVHSLAVLDGAEAVVIARSVPPATSARLLAHGIHLGARLPAHATSTGKVLLAALPAEALERWLQAHAGPAGLPTLTARTIGAPAQLRATLAAIARAGYCQSSAEHEPGVHAVAVPLCNIRGNTLAALNAVATGDPRAALARLLPATAVLQEAAAALRTAVS